MPKILIQGVVVLYNCTPEDSRTMQSLAVFCRERSELAARLAVLVYDNSPQPQTLDLRDWSFGKITFRHDSLNGGLAGAYGEALAMAQEAEIEWLLLLDQDTALGEEFFLQLFAAIGGGPPAEICAVVPRLAQAEDGRGQLLSPQGVGRFRRYDLPAGFSGVFAAPVAALNSAACLRVAAVAAIGGFAREYWLDYLDHVMFHRLQAAGGKVLVLNTQIEHRLSLKSIEAEMSLGRYANMLAAESRFVRETGFGGGPILHRLRLLKRGILQAVRLRSKAYAAQTMRAALR